MYVSKIKAQQEKAKEDAELECKLYKRPTPSIIGAFICKEKGKLRKELRLE